MLEINKNIQSNHRYLFHSQMPGTEKIILFKADFIDIIDKTLRVKNVYCDTEKSYHNCGIMSIPYSWIIKIDTLNDIISNDIILPTDILLNINMY